MARHNAQNGQKGCDNHSPFKSTVHTGYNFPCSMIITQIARRRVRSTYRRRRRISVPFGREGGAHRRCKNGWRSVEVDLALSLVTQPIQRSVLKACTSLRLGGEPAENFFLGISVHIALDLV